MGPLGCLTKLSGKQAEQVQKFVPRNRVGIFQNERTRSTPLDPKLMFWCVFHTIWVHLVLFGCLTKLGAERGELVQKFVSRSRVRIFRKERTRSTPLDPKLTFLVHFILLGCIRDRLVFIQNWCKTYQSSVKVRAMKSRWNFSQRTHTIHPVGP